MSEDTTDENLLNGSDQPDEQAQDHSEVGVVKISGMYQNWFLDYASYVILERAVPSINDGFKPVQRRIMHSMKELDDGRYSKVANLIGNTMKYHPHGDASIGDAMVQLGQKDLLIDTQGNWGNTLTGDRAAAPRYIEARLSKFALQVLFNPKITEWQASYDGRNKEPVNLPVKFPILLAQGVEGIAVGLSTKILPHNFNELIDASIKVLKGKPFVLYPDFPTGGIADVSNYQDGLRGGKVRVRAKIRQEDKKTLIVEQIPFGTTTSSLIDSILKANDKGKIKIRKVEDNTASEAEVTVHLPNGVSPDKMIDALYAFTDCEISISPLSCVIKNEKPIFVGVSELLKYNTEYTVELLKQELQIKLREFEESWHLASLEKIFIENKIYMHFDGLTYEEAIELTFEKLKPFTKHLVREVNEDDVKKLLEIKMRRITKHDAEKADTHIAGLEDQIALVKSQLDNIIDYSIDYFKELKRKYGKGKERKTELHAFDDIDATKVAVKSEKLYVNRKDGFVGTGLKKEEYVSDCSDIDDIIVFKKDGTFSITKVQPKAFVGKNIIHVAVWKKKDSRTVYNVIYRDGKAGFSFMKRFAVTSVTRDREYPVTQGKPGSAILYFTANPNGEAEIVTINLKANVAKKAKFDLDFSELAIKGRGVKGNLVTKMPIRKIDLKERGVSTLEARKLWYDETVKRLNTEERGELLGAFAGDDKILTVTQQGVLKLLPAEPSVHFDRNLQILQKWDPKAPVSVVYFDGEKKRTYVKRFIVDSNLKEEHIIPDSSGSALLFVSTDYLPQIEVEFVKERGKDRKENQIVKLADFISIKGIKAQGNQLSSAKIKGVIALESLSYTPEPEEKEEDDTQVSLDF